MKLVKNFSKKVFKKKYINLKIFFIVLSIIVLIATISWLIAFLLKNILSEDSYYPKYSETIGGPLKASILFNNEAGAKVFSPEIINLIRQAQKSIDIAMYSMDSSELRDELYEAAKRGVLVRLVVSYNKTSPYRNLFAEKNKNIYIKELASDKTESFMHNKFIIADAKVVNSSMITGSFNPTNLQEMYDPSFIFKTSDSSLISVFDQEFNRLFNGLSGRAKFGDETYRAWQKNLNYQNGKIEIWWSPGLGKNSLKTRMMELIYQAQESIDVMIWQITDQDIAQALIDKAKTGIKIRIITDDSNAWSDVSKISGLVSESLSNSNLIIADDAARTKDFLGEIYKDESIDKNSFNSFFHHHALIIDRKILVTGSGNWSYRANFSNDENALVIHVPELVQAYQDSFNFNFDKLHKQKIILSIKDEKIFLHNLNNFSNSRLVVLQESPDLYPISQICLEDMVMANEMIIDVPDACKDKALNIFIINSSGQVIANRLLGEIFK